MGSKKSTNVWKDAIDSLHFTDTVESVKAKLAEVTPDYSYDQFIKDCEAFYDLYIDFIGFNDDKSPSKNLQIQFHKVARLLNMNGHVPDQVEAEATDSMFKYLTESSQPIVNTEEIRTASSNTNQDSFNLQDHLAFGLSNDMPTDNVDAVELIDGKPKLSCHKVLNVKIGSEHLAEDSAYISSLVDLYKIGDTFFDTKFDRDKMLVSLLYK